MLLTVFMIPVDITGALLGFLAFRAADVVKPYPANRLEKLHGGVGVMADDAMAAIYANLALRAMLALGRLVIE
jgi:phosphatidylglycerophosphatase A